MSNTNKIKKVQSPALPIPPQGSPVSSYLSSLNNILRLFFNQVDNTLNLLTGANGGVFISNPNGLFWDNGNQALAAVNVPQPVRFNQIYLDNGFTINGGVSLSQVTVEFSGIYNFQFTGIVRSGSASAKTGYVWIRRNGVNVGYSARPFIVTGAGREVEIVWAFDIDLLAGQYIEMVWVGDDIDLTLTSLAPTLVHPGVPSAVIAINYISALPETLPTPS